VCAFGVGESDLHRLADLAAELSAEPVARAARLAAERVSEGRFYVACLGQFKRGKSTLLNALVGHTILPVGVVPVTSVPTILRYGPLLSARVRLPGAEWSEIPPNEIEEYVSENKNPENCKRIEALEIFVPSPLLASGMCLVDTPGLGSVFAGNAKAARDFIPQIDAALFVVGADPPISGEELDFAEKVARQTREILFVLNKADRTSEIDRATSAAFSRQVLETRLGRPVADIFQVSALDRLERRGPERDWPKLLSVLEQLVQKSGEDLVHAATERTIRRAAGDLLATINENRRALLQPIEESELRLVELQLTVERATAAIHDMGALLNTEQERLSRILGERRRRFLAESRQVVCDELRARFPAVKHRRNGPAHRREIMHQAQEIARARVAPWLELGEGFAEDAFRGAVSRFVQTGNDFLRRLREAALPASANFPHALDPEWKLARESQFHFHFMERIAAPASPLVFGADLVRGMLGIRGGMQRDAEEFASELLEVNSARVQSDFIERVLESRRKLEAEIKAVLRGAVSMAEFALARAKDARTAGAQAVQASLVRLDEAEREILKIVDEQGASERSIHPSLGNPIVESE
jgi:dynamin family protein